MHMQGFCPVGWRDLYDKQTICTAVVPLGQHHYVKLRYSIPANFVLGDNTAPYI